MALMRLMLMRNDVRNCHASKPTSRAWWSFHTLNLKAQSENDTNIRIVIFKFLFKVVGQNSKISKYQF